MRHHRIHPAPPRVAARPRARAGLLALAAGSLLLSACSLGGGGDDDSAAEATRAVVLATHDSWYVPDETLAAFEEASGYEVTVQPLGDAGELTNKLVLTADNPVADAVYGIDNTFAGRAVEAGVLAPYASPALPPSAEDYALDGEAGDVLTPVDWSDVCVNVDDAWFAEEGLTPPRTLEDLTDPAYRDLFVTSGASTSSPGFAFLLGTIGTFGEDGWQDYWRALLDNGARVVSGWSDAYEVDFTAGGGGGDRPIVLSYSSSPPFTIPEGEQRPTTSALLDTCVRQVEYAGVLEDAENPEGAQALVDFLVSADFQSILADNMYVYPVDEDVALPELWARWATPAPSPVAIDPAEIDDRREDWIREWSDLTS